MVKPNVNGLLDLHFPASSQVFAFGAMAASPAKPATHINTNDSMGGSVPTVEMITVELV